MNIESELRAAASEHLYKSAELKRRVAEECLESIIEAARLMIDSLASGGKLLLCGNGGSAADCQHIAAELVSILSKDFERPAIAAIALTTDSSILTAYANDFGFEGVFSRQVQALGRPGDVLIGISTSGSSKNVLLAIEAARDRGMKVVGLTGPGGEMQALTDAAIRVPSDSTPHIQEAHITIGHILCMLIERNLFEPLLNLPKTS